MTLHEIPSAIWKAIVLDWLTLREVIVTDAALCCLRESNPVKSIARNHQFAFFGWNWKPKHLAGLLLWMRCRKVYFNELNISGLEPHDSATFWDDFFEWTGSKIGNMQLDAFDKSEMVATTTLWNSAAPTLTSLFKLSVKSPIFRFPAGLDFTTALLNNSDSLQILMLECMHLSSRLLQALVYSFPRLQVFRLTAVQWSEHVSLDLSHMSHNCPNLTALSISGQMQLSLIVSSPMKQPPALQRLQIFSLDSLRDDVLWEIVRNCPGIVHLEVWGCDNISANKFGQWTHALPQLRTLIVGHLDHTSATDIAEHGAPSLRTLGAYHEVLVSSIRTITAACPQLTELDIHNVEADMEMADSLQYCGELRYLRLELENEVDGFLESAARYCHRLEKLNVFECGYNIESLNACLASCTNLKELVISGGHSEIEIPANNSALQLSGDDIWPGEWIPGESM